MKNRILRLCILALAFLTIPIMAEKECVEKIEDVEWCVEGIKLESYRFPPREFQIALDLNSHPFMLNDKNRFSALVNWWNVKIVVDKKLAESGDAVTIAGYFYKPDYERPDLAIIFVKNRERKRQVENDIKVAQKKFAENCFGCEQLGIKDPGPGSSKKRK